MNKKRIAFMLFILLIIVAFSACQQQATAQTPSPSNVPTATVQPAPAPRYELNFYDAVLFGSEHAIISAAFTPADADITEFGFVLSGVDDALAATEIDGVVYATLAGLSPNTQYIYNLWYLDGDEMKTTDEAFTFTTPARQISQDELNEYIYAELDGKTVTEENRLLLETQACLSLLGLEIDRYGKWGAVTQANLTRVVYTANAIDSFVDYSHISATADEYALNLLKDILSLDLLTNGEALIKPFTPMPHALTNYARVNEEGGSLDIEHYIATLASADSAIAALAEEYPYDITTDAFKTLYAETIADPGFSEKGRTEKLAGYAAKNKAMFSYKANDWMEQVAVPQERLVTFAGSENQITINTYVAYAYLLIDAYRATGDVLMTSTTYRDLDKQWYFYSEKKDPSVAYRHSGSWHLKRQRFSYVPGFSNHQYGVAIDFYERTTFGDTDLFEYINAHGNDYGFYNYYLEPWHWAYLGKIF